MAFLEEASIVSGDWVFCIYSSKLNAMGHDAIPMSNPNWHNVWLQRKDYLSNLAGHISQFSGMLFGDDAYSICGYGITCNSQSDSIFPSLCLIANVNSYDNELLSVVPLLISRSIDMCSILFSPIFSESDRFYSTNYVYCFMVTDDKENLFTNGGKVNMWDFAYSMAKSKNCSIGIFRVDGLNLPTAFLACSGEDSGRVYEYIHKNMDDSDPLLYSTVCGTMIQYARRNIDNYLRGKNVMLDTVLGRIPKGSSFASGFLRIQKGGQFTGEPKGQ